MGAERKINGSLNVGDAYTAFSLILRTVCYTYNERFTKGGVAMF
jgi:hypothetical protein